MDQEVCGRPQKKAFRRIFEGHRKEKVTFLTGTTGPKGDVQKKNGKTKKQSRLKKTSREKHGLDESGVMQKKQQ